jgi:hypothetical protein
MRSCQECCLRDFNHFQKLVTFLEQFLVIFNVSRFEASKFDFVDPLYFSLQPGTQQFATMIALYSILHYKPGKMVFTGEWRI